MNNNPLHTRVILGGVELCPFTWPLGLKSIKGTTPSFGLTPSPYVRDRLVFPMELMSAAEAVAIVDIPTLRQWAGLPVEAWNAVSARLGITYPTSEYLP